MCIYNGRRHAKGKKRAILTKQEEAKMPDLEKRVEFLEAQMQLSNKMVQNLAEVCKQFEKMLKIITKEEDQ